MRERILVVGLSSRSCHIASTMVEDLPDIESRFQLVHILQNDSSKFKTMLLLRTSFTNPWYTSAFLSHISQQGYNHQGALMGTSLRVQVLDICNSKYSPGRFNALVVLSLGHLCPFCCTLQHRVVLQRT
ncbi:3655_t:CDS:2 [Funneliformis caledonium]|uniref:3655_t:CDS:1 n=1 Tax=Funneliformis caledonium TaxID=1117310 RepID=A0A9N9E4Z1_9GLOM|nr:3655_t:CDS:2 [Funneliformis caledonium]